MAERKPPSGAKPAFYNRSLTTPIQVTGEREENSTSVFLEDQSQLKPSVGFKSYEHGGVRIGTIKCVAHYVPEEYLSSQCLEWQVAFCDLKRSISEHDLFSAKNSRRGMLSYLFSVPFDSQAKTLEEKVKLGRCGSTDTEKIEERRKKHKLLHGFGEVKEHYVVGDGHVVVPFVRLINKQTKKDICPVLYLPPIYDSNVYVAPTVEHCQAEEESSTLVFHLKKSAKTIEWVVLSNGLKELQRIQIPPNKFVDKKVEVSYNSETLRGCIDVCASLITVNGLSSKPATKLWFNGQRLQKPGYTAPVTMAVPQQVSHTTAVSTHPVEVNEGEVDVEEGDFEADGARTNVMAVDLEDVKDSCTTGDGVVTHGVHPNQDAVASHADILREAITKASIANDIKKCALYEELDCGNPSLAEEFKPRLCAVSMNPVDEDDGKLILPGSVKDDLNCLTEEEIMHLSWVEETIQETMSLDSCEIYDRMKGFPDLDDDAVSQKAADTPNAVVETDGEVKSEYTVETEDKREAYNGREEGDGGVLSEHNKAVLDRLPMKELLGSIHPSGCSSHVQPRKSLQIPKKFLIQQQSTRSSEMTFKSSTIVRPPQPDLPSNCGTEELGQDRGLDQLSGCDDSGVYNDSTRHEPDSGATTGPDAGPNTGGPNTVPAGGPNTGPGYTVNQNLAANESYRDKSPLKPVGNPHHRTRMQNHNTGSSGSRSIAAPSSTDTKIQRPELANGFQNPRKTQTRKAHGYKAKPVTSSPFSRAAEKRRSSSPEPIGSSRGCKERMLSWAEPPKLVPVTVEFASSPKATDGGGDFPPTVLDDISPPTSPELLPPYPALHMPAGLGFAAKRKSKKK